MLKTKNPALGATRQGQRIKLVYSDNSNIPLVFRQHCLGCGVALSFQDGGSLCRHCRHTEANNPIHTVRPGFHCPDCGAEVARW